CMASHYTQNLPRRKGRVGMWLEIFLVLEQDRSSAANDSIPAQLHVLPADRQAVEVRAESRSDSRTVGELNRLRSADGQRNRSTKPSIALARPCRTVVQMRSAAAVPRRVKRHPQSTAQGITQMRLKRSEHILAANRLSGKERVVGGEELR